jgi:ribosomal protein L11 methyltransferase
VLSVSLPDDQRADLLPQLLVELGGAGVEESEDRYTTYLQPPNDLPRFLQEAEAMLRSRTGLPGLTLDWEWQGHEAWEDLWKRGLRARRITDRLWVSPSWETPSLEEGEVLVTVDPGMAFGTAEHATTRGCLRLLERVLSPGDRVADVGAGSGILSIAAALLGAREVTAFELDPDACDVATENARGNGVGPKVRVLSGAVEGGEPLPEAPFNGILANLQLSTLLPLLPSFHRSLVPEGWVVLSGLLQGEEGDLVSEAGSVGFGLENEDREGEWWSGVFRGPCPPA